MAFIRETCLAPELAKLNQDCLTHNNGHGACSSAECKCLCYTLQRPSKSLSNKLQQVNGNVINAIEGNLNVF